MMINRIDPIEPIQPGKKTGRSGEVNSRPKTDVISVSSEAVEKNELYRAIELASAAPDARAERIAELREKINDPNYINETIIKATAEKIMDAFGL